jgi:parallel beta-helix repeat protein
MSIKKMMPTVALSSILAIVSFSSLVTVPDEVSAYTPHAPVIINGNGDFTVANGVTGGIGTASDPYIVEGWEIDASTATGIEIFNTDAHFVIRDVYVHSGGSSFNGIYFDNVTNSRIENTTISDNYYGIRFLNSNNATIMGSNVTKHGNFGIYFDFGNNTTLVDNNVTWNDNYGIYLDISNNSTISGNTISNNRLGVALWSSRSAKIAGNTFIKNGLTVGGYTLPFYDSHTIAADNTVNGYPLYFYEDCSGLDIDGIPIGQLIVVNCTDVRASNLHITDTDVGIGMAFVENVSATSNTLSNNVGGIGILLSANFTISNNIVSSNALYGVGLAYSTNGTITNGDFSNSFTGIYMNSSANISVHHNNFVNNTLHAYDDGGPENSWDDGYPSGGNYWDNYTGVDQRSGPNQDQPGSDEIGDSPYDIDSDSRDRYPLMSPVGVVSPQPPVLLSADLSGQNFENVSLSWAPSPDDGAGLNSVTGYEIYRNGTFDSDGLGYQLIASLPNGTSTFADDYSGEGNPVNYFYRVCAIDMSGNSSCASDQAGKFTRPLSEGMNLVSYPLMQSDESIKTVLQTVFYDSAWSYDSISQEWKSFVKSEPYSGGLAHLNHSVGFWINVTKDSNLTVAGIVPSSTSIHLLEGWNLISFPSFKSNYTAADLKLETNANRIETFSQMSPPYNLKEPNDSDFLLSGLGYWINVNSETVWTVKIK